jgi:hypothetical protein
MSDDDEEGGIGSTIIGLLIFLGIFVVINAILYFTTGWVLIPKK